MARTYLTDARVGPGGARRPAAPRDRLPGRARARPADHRDRAAVVRSHPGGSRQPSGPAQPWVLEQADAHVFVVFPEIAALRAMSLLISVPGPRRAALDGEDAPRHQPRLPQGAAEDARRREPPARQAGGRGPYTEVEMIRSVNEGVPLVIGRPGSAPRQAVGAMRPRSGHRRVDRHRAAGRWLPAKRPAKRTRRCSRRPGAVAEAVVPEEGLEPPRLAAAGFKPAASAIPPLRRRSARVYRLLS